MVNLVLSQTFWLKLKDWFIQSFSNLNFGKIVILITGIFIGMALLSLIYGVNVLISFKRQKRKIDENQTTVDEKEVNLIINDACQYYVDNYTSGAIKDKVDAVKLISLDVIKKIATLYFPNSKNPMLELSIDETIVLFSYITKRIDDLFDARALRIFRRLRISQIQEAIEIKKRIDNSRAVQAAKKANSSKISQIGKAILNVLNPAYWLRKAIFGPALKLTLNKMALVIIRIAGEEAYKVYSKSVLNEEKETLELIEQLNSSLEE